MQELLSITFNITIPILAGFIFFAMAFYIKKIAPIRSLILGARTYKAAFWGFIAFGIYLSTRPLQILCGPHPMPLIINNIREFFMIGIFGPGVLLAIIGLSYGIENLSKKVIMLIFFSGILLALIFAITNIFTIGGSKLLFKIGDYPAYDGLWFENPDLKSRELMRILFLVRLTDPVIFLAVGGIIALWRCFSYPQELKKYYTNMPKKLFFAGLSCLFFSLSMLAVGMLYVTVKIPNQWWIYYLGAFAAGISELISLSFPVKSEISVE